MTPERKKWWDSLPQGERELREAIANNELQKQFTKHLLLTAGTEDVETIEIDGSKISVDVLKKDIRQHKLIIKALKHELEREGKCGVIYRNVCNVLMPKCDVCGGVIGGNIKPVKFCSCCGRKIKRTEV